MVSLALRKSVAGAHAAGDLGGRDRVRGDPNRVGPTIRPRFSYDFGVHPKLVQERLGDPSITLDLYSHVVASMQRDAAEAVAVLITHRSA